MKLKIRIAAAALAVAAATIAPLSAAADTSTVGPPCPLRTVAASWNGRGWASVKDAAGNVWTVNAGSPRGICKPSYLYVSAGYDGAAWTGGTNTSGYNFASWTSTGNHAFTAAQKASTATLWVRIN